MSRLFKTISFFDSDRAIHSVKTVIACLFGFLAARLLHVTHEQWIIITILVVMCAQSRVGALLQKSYMRFLGTLIGGVIAGVTLIFFGSNLIATIVTLCLAALWFSYIAESPSVLSDAGTIGAVTVAIILLTPEQSLTLAAARFLEINLGIVIALLVSRFLWPLHSRTRLLHGIAKTIRELKAFYLLLAAEKFISTETIDIDYEEKIIGGLIRQRKLFEEVVRESFSPIPLVIKFKNILYAEREILRNVSLMYHALHSVAEKTFAALNHCVAWQQLHMNIEHIFTDIIATLQSKKISTTSIAIMADWEKQIRESIGGDVVDILQIDSFLFCTERLLQQLTSLQKEINQLFYINSGIENVISE